MEVALVVEVVKGGLVVRDVVVVVWDWDGAGEEGRGVLPLLG